jgi:hypothetical protein
MAAAQPPPGAAMGLARGLAAGARGVGGRRGGWGGSRAPSVPRRTRPCPAVPLRAALCPPGAPRRARLTGRGRAAPHRSGPRRWGRGAHQSGPPARRRQVGSGARARWRRAGGVRVAGELGGRRRRALLSVAVLACDPGGGKAGARARALGARISGCAGQEGRGAGGTKRLGAPVGSCRQRQRGGRRAPAARRAARPPPPVSRPAPRRPGRRAAPRAPPAAP